MDKKIFWIPGELKNVPELRNQSPQTRHLEKKNNAYWVDCVQQNIGKSEVSDSAIVWVHVSMPILMDRFDFYESVRPIVYALKKTGWINEDRYEIEVSQVAGAPGTMIFVQGIGFVTDRGVIKKRFEQLRQAIMRNIQSSMRAYENKNFFKGENRVSWSQNLETNLSFFDMKSLSYYKGEFSNKRAVVVGAGPSLDKNIDELHHRDSDTLIIATNSSVRALVFRGIYPSFVVAAEEHPILTRYLEGVQIMGAPLLASSTVHPNYARKYKDLGGEIFFYNNVTDTLKNRFEQKSNLTKKVERLPNIDPVAGNITFHAIEIARYMGVEEIAIIGCDLQITEEAHHDKHYPKGMNSKGTDDRFKSALRRSFGKTLMMSKKVDPKGITNCTEGGALDTFPLMTLKDWMER